MICSGMSLTSTAVQAGLNVPPPPPIAHPLHPLAPQLPAPQPIVPIPMANIQQQQQQQQQQPQPQAGAQPAAPAACTDRLQGDPPAAFTGDRDKSDDFLREFDMYRSLNELHELMTVPYFRAMLALSYMKGPHVS